MRHCWIEALGQKGEIGFSKLVQTSSRTGFLSWATWFLLAPLIPISWLYGCVFCIVKRLQRRRRYVPEVFSLCIGNISLGGTGKTPLLMKILKETSAAQDMLYIARGYGRLRQYGDEEPLDPLLGKDATFERVGDEALLIAKKFPTLSLVIGSNSKKRAVQYHAKQKTKPMIVVDDALQHDEIGFHLRVATVDGKNPYGYGWLFPRGFLREPKSKLKDVDYIVVTNISNIDEAVSLQKEFEEEFDRPVICMKSSFHRFFNIDGDTVCIDPSTTEAFLLTAIANPSRVSRLIQQETGLRILQHFIFPDHFDPSIESVHQQIEAYEKRHPVGNKKSRILITTEKDWARKHSWEGVGVPVLCMEVGLEVLAGEEEWRECLQRIQNGIHVGRTIYPK